MPGIPHRPVGHHSGHALLDCQQPRQCAAVGTDVEQHDNAPVSLWDEGHASVSAGFVAGMVGRVHPAPWAGEPAHAVACAGECASFLRRPRPHHLGDPGR
jgi:hypothetical protein